LGYISPICPEVLHGRIFTKFCTAVEVVDVSPMTNFYCSVKGRRFCVGFKMDGSYRINQWLSGC